MTARTSADAPYVYDGTELSETDQAAQTRKAEKEAAGKAPAALFEMAESEYYMATRHYTRTEGREWMADRAMLRAVTFDRLARELESGYVREFSHDLTEREAEAAERLETLPTPQLREIVLRTTAAGEAIVERARVVLAQRESEGANQ